ncbi:MAG: DNA polymerase domain-containing protein, partial [Rhodothermales bacterium]
MPPPPSAAPLSDVALFGRDATPRIVDVHPLRGGTDDETARVRVYRRSEDGLCVAEEIEPFYPFFFLSDVELLRGFPRERYQFQPLEGDNFYRHLVAFGSWGAYWDAVRHVERATESAEKRPLELYLVNNPAQQYLMQTGRTLFKGMAFDDLHRLQLDIETYTESGFPNAEREADEVIIVSLSDNRGWTRLIEGRALPERTMLEEVVRVIQEKDPDVIEGHNCFRAGTPVLTPGGFASIEHLRVGDRVVAHGPQGLTASRVTHRFENAFSGDLVSLHAVYKGKITSTPDHPHFGYTKQHGLGYRPARDFERGDYLAVPLKQAAALSFEEDFYLAGLIFSDGHLSKDTHRISFGNTDKALVEWVASRVGGRGTIRYRSGNERHAPLYRLRTHDARMHAWLRSLGIPAGDKSSCDAPIPIECIAEQGASRIASFLAGVIDGDGHISSTNGNLFIACQPKRGRVALQALVQHIGLVASESAFGILLRPSQTADATLRCIQDWLRIGHKRTSEMGRSRRRVDELPAVVIEKICPFVKSLGLGYDDFPLPRTTVNYYLNGRTSINRSTFARLEETIEAAITNEHLPAWERTKAELDEIRGFYWFPIRRKSAEPFAGTVYNIETEHHNYIASGILTHNCYAFDFPYLMTRCARHGVPFAIGRDGSVPRSFPSSMRFAERTIDFPALEIAGRHVVDTYFQVMAYDVFKRDLRGYGLKAAARYFGFAPEGRTYVPGDQIGRVWKEDPERLLAYALDDVIETERLARHLSGSTFYLTQMLPMPYGQVARTGPASKIESLFVREYLRRRHALPKSEWGSQAVGGYTDVFVTGIVGPVVYADVESLYPSIMLHYDVRPKGDELHLFPDLLHRLTDLRFEAKAAMGEATSDEAKGELDARQTAYKNVINSFYGSRGFSLAAFNDCAEADRVASIGQDIL